METILGSLGKELYAHGNHKGYLIAWNLISPLCAKWSRNRDTDKVRVKEMVEFYQKGGYLPSVIHVAEVFEEGLVCYDGNHRREVFDQLEDKRLCIVDVIFKASQYDVYQAFEHINKAVQLPAIYLDDNNTSQLVKDKILQLVKSYELRYKPFLSTSSRYHTPNFNRDTFVDNIYHIYTSLRGTISIDDLGKLLERLNEEYAKGNLCRPHKNYKKTILDKCAKYGLWLFLDRSIPVEHVEHLIHQ